MLPAKTAVRYSDLRLNSRKVATQSPDANTAWGSRFTLLHSSSTVGPHSEELSTSTLTQPEETTTQRYAEPEEAGTGRLHFITGSHVGS
jgi:hypothetical protein